MATINEKAILTLIPLTPMHWGIRDTDLIHDLSAVALRRIKNVGFSFAPFYSIFTFRRSDLEYYECGTGIEILGLTGITIGFFWTIAKSRTSIGAYTRT